MQFIASKVCTVRSVMSTFIPSFITTVWNSSQSLCCLQIFQSENAECLDQWIEDSLYGTSARKYREAPGVCVAGLALPSQEFSVWSVGASWMQWYGFVIGQRHLVWWLFVYLYCIKKKNKKTYPICVESSMCWLISTNIHNNAYKKNTQYTRIS